MTSDAGTSQLEISTGGQRADDEGDTTQLVNDERSWSNLSPKMKKLIIIGALIILILLVIIIALVIFWPRTGTAVSCPLRSKIPILNKPLGVYTKPDASNMAKLAGYIYVYNQGFLPLDIKRMRIDSDQRDRIILEDDCVQVSFGKYIYDNGTEQISDLGWTSTNNMKLAYGNCYSETPSFEHRFPNARRYSCLDRETHQCKKTGEDGQFYAASELVIESFELEINGNPDMIKQGKFSKSLYPSSCSQ